MTDLLTRASRGLRWYLRAVSGESRWDEHVARCARDGRDPGSRRDFERHRADLREHRTTSRCC